MIAREYRITNNGEMYRIEVLSGWWIWRRWCPVDSHTYATLVTAEMYAQYRRDEDAYRSRLGGQWTTAKTDAGSRR